MRKVFFLRYSASLGTSSGSINDNTARSSGLREA